MPTKLFFALGIVISLFIRAYLTLNGSDIADIHSLGEMADLVLRHINPYLALSYYTYPPLALYIQALTLYLSKLSSIPFYILIKLWPNFADILITFLIYRFLIKKGAGQKLATIWSLVYFLNPVSIIISSAHGQLDSIPTFLVILATFILTFKPEKFYTFLASLFFGLAISIKPNPLILLPIFLLFSKMNFKRKILFSILAITPVILFLISFVDVYPQYVFRKILNYSGATDFGLAAVVRGVMYFKTNNYLFNFSGDILTMSKLFFLLSLILFIAIFKKTRKLIFGSLSGYLLFLGFYLGISGQYLLWVLPFACLGRDKMIVPYSLFAALALVGFYLLINPAIIVSQLAAIFPDKQLSLGLYVLGNGLLWVVTMIWIFKLLKYPKVYDNVDS